MRVRSILTPDPVCVRAGATLDEAIDRMDEHEVRHLPVLAGAELVGIVSDRDLLAATGWLHPAQRAALEAPEQCVRDLVVRPAATIGPDQELVDVLAPLVEQRAGCVAVLEGGALVGVVSELDLLREFAHARALGRLPGGADPLLELYATTRVHTVSPDDSGDEAAAVLGETGVRHLPVVEAGRVIGLVSDRDLCRERGRGRLELTLVSELMTRDPLTARLDEPVSTAARLMAAAKVGALPLVASAGDRHLAGIVSVVDLLAPCARALQSLE